MTKAYTFRRTTSNELAWHLELQGGDVPIDRLTVPGGGGQGRYSESFWFDGEFGNGYQFSVGMFGGDIKHIDVHSTGPHGVVIHEHREFPKEAFRPEPFGASWDDNNYLRGKLGPDGKTLGYDIKATAGNLGIDIVTHAIIPFGVKFIDTEPGYTYYNPIKKTALGWWPLVPRAEAEGTVTMDGKANPVKGLAYLEHQVTSLPLGGAEGVKTGQAVWAWGHFFADNYTGVWTDSASSEHYGYRHFTPFVLWKGDTVVMSTFQCACYVEKFGVNSKTGMPYPVVETVKASDGITELFAQLLPGNVVEGAPGAWYCRQYCDAVVQIRRWGETEEIRGKSVHEWGAQEGRFPWKK